MQMETFRESEKKKQVATIYRWVSAAIILLALTMLSRSGYLDFLIPGDKTVTKQAFVSFVNDVSEGEGMKNAFTAFCQEVLDGAQTPY